MKYYLCSSFRRTYQQIVDDGVNLSSQKVGIILNAGDVYDDTSWIHRTVQVREDINSELLIIDLRESNASQLQEYLDSIDILYVNGGNVFYLTYLLHERGLYDIMKKRLLSNDKIYIGASAGAVILGSDISHVAYLEKHFDASRAIGLDTLNVITFNIVPHWGYERYQEKHNANFMNTHYYNHICPLVLISNYQVICIQDGQIKFLHNKYGAST